MRILLTGAAGFIGSSLGDFLLARGDEVVGLDSFDETLYPASIKRQNLASLLGAPRFSFVEGDLLDAPLVDRLVAGGPDVVAHIGGLAGVRPSLEQPRRYQRTNTEGTLGLLESCRARGVERVVFASTSSVYGSRPLVAGEAPRAFREDDPAVRPASPYAASKRAAELFCFNHAELFPLHTTALRFFTVYGPRQRPEMAIHKFARLIDEGRPVPFFGDGSTARDYTFIDDILEGVVRAIDRVGQPGAPTESSPGAAGSYRVYNLGGSRTTTLGRLVELLEDALGKKAILDRKPDQPGDVPITFADVSRAGAELGYAPRVPIEEGIVRFVRWYRDHAAPR